MKPTLERTSTRLVRLFTGLWRTMHERGSVHDPKLEEVRLRNVSLLHVVLRRLNAPCRIPVRQHEHLLGFECVTGDRRQDKDRGDRDRSTGDQLEKSSNKGLDTMQCFTREGPVWFRRSCSVFSKPNMLSDHWTDLGSHRNGEFLPKTNATMTQTRTIVRTVFLDMRISCMRWRVR